MWSPRVFGPLFVIVITVQVMNAFGIVFDRGFGPYFLALVFFLILAATNLLMLLAQLWTSED